MLGLLLPKTALQALMRSLVWISLSANLFPESELNIQRGIKDDIGGEGVSRNEGGKESQWEMHRGSPRAGTRPRLPTRCPGDHYLLKPLKWEASPSFPRWTALPLCWMVHFSVSRRMQQDGDSQRDTCFHRLQNNLECSQLIYLPGTMYKMSLHQI